MANKQSFEKTHFGVALNRRERSASGESRKGRPDKRTAEQQKMGEQRRRIEDILEASRLESDALGEVWEV